VSRTARRWRIRRWLRGPGRFYFSLVFTAVVVAYVAVPWIVQIVETAGGYNPGYYEPKDIQREDYLKRLPPSPEGFFGWETAFKLVLLVLVGLVWLVAVPSAPWRGRGTRRR
jgi:hypothetical protein